MEVQKMLYSKNGLSTRELARMFIPFQVGERIPTVTAIHEHTKAARGTIQNAMKLLQSCGAITLEARGHLGSFLIKKDMQILLEIAGINAIVGVMPLPYSKRYEGFATGILAALKNTYQIPVAMAYMRGAQKRIEHMISGRYDFAIISGYAAKKLMEADEQIQIVQSFGNYSYLSKHVIIFSSKESFSIEDGMKVGIDNDSVDQKLLTQQICKNKNVQYVHVDYSQTLKRVLSGEIDAAIWNKDEILDKEIDINYVELEEGEIPTNEAVLVVNKQETVMLSLLKHMIDIDTVKKIQKLVLEGKMEPSY